MAVKEKAVRSADGALTERSVFETFGLVSGVLGITAVIFGSVLYALDPDVLGLTVANVAFGIICIAFYVLTNWRSLLRAAGGRSSAFVAVETLIIISVLAGVATINYFVAKSPKEWDLTRDRLFSLHEQSQKVARGLKESVKIIGFFQSTENGHAILKEAVAVYRLHTKKITLEFINPESPPPEIVKKYAMTSRSPRIVFVGANDRYTKIKKPTEEAMTNALIKVAERAARKAYFLTGHDELGISDKTEDGYQFAAGILRDVGFDVETLSLVDKSAVPKDASIVVLAGAKTPLLANEIEALRSWVNRGGRALLLLEPGIDNGLTEFWPPFGVEVGDDLVLEPNPAAKAAGLGPESPVVQEFEPHPITNPLKGVAAVFFSARSVQPKIGLANLTVTTLVQTGPTSWGETSYRDTSREQHERDEQDIPGPVPIAVAVTKNTGAAGHKTSDEGRIVVVGDYHFIANKLAKMSGNRGLFLNAANWLAGDEDRISITPPSRDGQRLNLTEMQLEGVVFFSVNLLPLLIIGFGFSVWAVRRRK